ncbi:RNA methyltransferase [Candidatus Peregrinibacteria bacterium]|nr:RNA methyltransferase [Candidatus Peregrinibacteria bacterium]
MRKDVYVLLNNIRSLHNVGSIFRTADGAGVKKIFLCGQTGYPPREEITKTAIGAEETVPWEYWIDAKECIKKLCHSDQGGGMNKKSIQLVALEQTKKSIDYRKFKSKYPICLVLGHEIDGVEHGILDLCDEAIEIPMHGKKQSLNVSVAFGIAVYSL